MGLFERKVTIFKKKDRQTWEQIRDVLKAEGLKVHAGHYQGDGLIPSGCGAKLDPRDIGVGKRVDRDIYFIELRESDQARAKEIIRSHGLVAVVDEKAQMDAAEKLNLKKNDAAGI